MANLLYPIDYNQYRSVKGFNSRVRFLVLHYTAGNFLSSIQELTTTSLVSAHYLVPDPSDPSYKQAGFTDLRILNLVDEEERAWHAGFSGWRNRSNLNDTSIGIETVNLATQKEVGDNCNFPPYNPEQVQAIIELVVNIVQRYPEIVAKNVVGHSDIAYTRKSDPGPMFPWKQLYEQGAGAWYDDQTVTQFKDEIAKGQLPITKQAMALQFKKYGYSVSNDIGDQNYTRLVRAFQMHFRPEKYDGVMDCETAAILYALNQKYP